MTTTNATEDTLNDLFEKWYEQFGCRYYTKDGHKQYLNYAFTNGLLHGLNAALNLQGNVPQAKRKTRRSIFRYP